MVSVSQPSVSVSQPSVSVSQPVVSVSQPSVSVSQPPNTTEIKLEKENKYKLPELQEIAKKLDIGIKKTGCQRNKKKSDLYQEIKIKLGC